MCTGPSTFAPTPTRTPVTESGLPVRATSVADGHALVGDEVAPGPHLVADDDVDAVHKGEPRPDLRCRVQHCAKGRVTRRG